MKPSRENDQSASLSGRILAQKCQAIVQVCQALQIGEIDRASSTLAHEYPFSPEPITQRHCREVDSTRVFLRDGFLDRYTGERLVFPPVLRAISAALPVQFPFHPNWKTDLTHPAYWEVGATIDHVVPVTRGGADDETNWVTTSMARNSAKMNWTLEELGWSLLPPGDLRKWDGLMGWFLDFVARYPVSLSTPSQRQWHKAAVALSSALPTRQSDR